MTKRLEHLKVEQLDKKMTGPAGGLTDGSLDK